MKITVSGRHMDVTESMERFVRDKVSKLDRYFDQIQSVDVILNHERDRNIAEMIITARVGGRFIGREAGPDMYAAIDVLMDKMERQMRRQKEKVKNRRKVSKEDNMAMLAEPSSEQMEEDVELGEDYAEETETA